MKFIKFIKGLFFKKSTQVSKEYFDIDKLDIDEVDKIVMKNANYKGGKMMPRESRQK